MKHSDTAQEKIILDYLQSGRGLTQIQALYKFGCMRLSGRINRLRNDGHDIQTEMIQKNGKRYALYRLI